MTTWTTGEAAAKCGLSQHTLRWYERIGLIGTIDGAATAVGGSATATWTGCRC